MLLLSIIMKIEIVIQYFYLNFFIQTVRPYGPLIIILTHLDHGHNERQHVMNLHAKMDINRPILMKLRLGDFDAGMACFQWGRARLRGSVNVEGREMVRYVRNWYFWEFWKLCAEGRIFTSSKKTLLYHANWITCRAQSRTEISSLIFRYRLDIDIEYQSRAKLTLGVSRVGYIGQKYVHLNG